MKTFWRLFKKKFKALPRPKNDDVILFGTQGPKCSACKKLLPLHVQKVSREVRVDLLPLKNAIPLKRIVFLSSSEQNGGGGGNKIKGHALSPRVG